MKPLQKLQELEYISRYADKPNYPEYARYKKKYSDKTANGLTKCIIDWVKFNGGFAERINTMGVPMDKRKVVTNVIGQQQQVGSLEWRRSGATRGSADVSCVINGKAIKVEVKAGRDRQSEAQKRYQAEVERAGAIYFIARNFDEFVEFYNTLT
ncbi:MAG: hypothetical protein ACLFQA_00220 [Bacteroidales bacterium]